eukprot:1236434-Pleurochrysis_carterae.AAC.5
MKQARSRSLGLSKACASTLCDGRAENSSAKLVGTKCARGPLFLCAQGELMPLLSASNPMGRAPRETQARRCGCLQIAWRSHGDRMEITWRSRLARTQLECSPHADRVQLARRLHADRIQIAWTSRADCMEITSTSYADPVQIARRP